MYYVMCYVIWYAMCYVMFYVMCFVMCYVMCYIMCYVMGRLWYWPMACDMSGHLDPAPTWQYQISDYTLDCHGVQAAQDVSG